MKVQLDTKKLLGFRIASGKTGARLGFKVGLKPGGMPPPAIEA